MIRSPGFEDIGEIINIEEQSFPNPWPHSTFLLLILGNGKILDAGGVIQMAIYQKSNRVAGYVVWECNSKEHRGHLLNIAVREDFRKQGIGTSLLTYAMDSLKESGAKSILLEVRPSNVRARTLYEHAGFNLTGRIDSYYSDEDALIYEYVF